MSRRTRRASSRTACSAQRSIRRDAGSVSSAASSSFSGSSSPTITKTRATSSTRRSVAAATAVTAGAWTSPGRSAWAVASSSGTPPPASRSATSRRAPWSSSPPSVGAAASSRRKPSRPASIVEPRSPDVALGEVPARDRVDEPVDAAHQLRLDLGLDLALEVLDRLPVGLRAHHLARDPVRPHHLGGPRAALGDELGDEHRAERVDHEVGVDRREQLAPQRVLVQQRAEALDHRLREVAAQVALEPRVLEQVGLEQRELDPALRVGQQQRQLRPLHPAARAPPLGQLLARRAAPRPRGRAGRPPRAPTIRSS